jgi:hypothetical protein
MNKSQLAHAMGVSPETISSWVRRGCSVKRMGHNGEAYQFDLPAVVKWRVGDLLERSHAGQGVTLDDIVVQLFNDIGGGQALLLRDFMDLSPEEAWVATEWTLKLMMDAVEMERHDVPAGTLAGHLLNPEARENLVARLAGHVVTP